MKQRSILASVEGSTCWMNAPIRLLVPSSQSGRRECTKITEKPIAVQREFIFFGVSIRQIPLERHRHRWKDNIEMNFQEIGYVGVEWVDLAQDRAGDWLLRTRQ